MSPEYAKELNRIFDLVESGQLPEAAVSRLFYMGHKTLYCFGHSPENEEWKCVGCGATWKGTQEHTCPSGAPESYVTNYLRGARWQCLRCKHEWEGEGGIRCPACQACEHSWGSPDGAPCTYCGKDKDEWMEEMPERQRIQGWVPGYYRDLLKKAQP